MLFRLLRNVRDHLVQTGSPGSRLRWSSAAGTRSRSTLGVQSGEGPEDGISGRRGRRLLMQLQQSLADPARELWGWAGLALQSRPKVGERGQALCPSINQALDKGCPSEGHMTLGKPALFGHGQSSERLPDENC